MGRPVVFLANRKTLFFVLQCTVAAWHNVVRSSQVWTSSKVPKFVIILPITVLGCFWRKHESWNFSPTISPCCMSEPMSSRSVQGCSGGEGAAAAKEQKKREQEAKVAKARKDPAGRVSARVSGCDFR
jgi:hypothetical protein